MKWISLIALAASTAFSAAALPTIETLHDMHLQTELVRGGKTRCLIAAPASEPGRRLANLLADAVAESAGVRPAVRSAADVTDEDLGLRNILALGVFANNTVLERLYRRGFVSCDWTWPKGEAAWVVRSVHNPWLKGTNVIAVQSVTEAGLEAAVAHLAERIRASKGALPPILEVRDDSAPPPKGKALEAAKSAIASSTSSRSMGGVTARYADKYYRTGHHEYATLFLAAMRKLDKLHEAEGDASDVRTCRYLHMQFDRIDEAPAFTQAERLELVNLFLRFACRMTYARRADVKTRAIPHGNDWNAIGASYAGIYFSRYYPKQPVGNHILKNLDALNEPNMRFWKVNEDCPGYGNITLTGNYDWALARPDNRFFELDCLRRMADYDLMISDNTARPSGYGDSSGLGGSYLVDAYSLASWIYKDGRYLWWYDKHGGKPNRFWTPPEVLPRTPPKELVGLSVAPLDDWIHNSRSARVKAETPRERCFDKATFRAGLEEQDSYLCIGGFCYGFHSHPDANAIIRYADRGEVRLYDDGYMIPGLDEHNTVMILKDGWTARTPDFAQVRLQSEFPDAGFFESRLAGYNGVDWDRTVLWLGRRCFLVVDELACLDPGVYSFQCIWRALGVAKLEGRSWRVQGKKGVFELVAASDAALTQREPAGTSLNAKPMPPSRARALIEGAQKTMEPGDAYRYANVFRTADERDAPLRAAPVAPGLYAIDTGDWQALAGIDQCTVAGLSLRAGAFQITSRTLRAAGLTEWVADDTALVASVPADVALDFETGRLLVRAKKPGTLTLRAKDGVKTMEITGEVRTVAALRLDTNACARIAAMITQALLPKSASADSADVAKPADLRRLWSYRKFDVCTDMSYTPGIVCSTMPAPLPKDYVKHGTGDAADLARPSANLMFPAGKTITATILLPRDMLLTGVVVKSRQLRTFRDGCGLRRITLRAASGDGAPRDIATLENNEALEDSVLPYTVAGGEPFTARRLEIVVTPYSPKHKVYLDSIMLEGIADRADVAGSGFQINALETADLDGDGKAEIVAGGTDRTVHAIAGRGQALWTARVGHSINAIAITRDAKGKTTQLAAACDDHKLYSLRPDGTENFTLQPPPRTYARPGYRGVQPFTGRLTVAVPGDLDGDGNQEIVIGSANWRAYVYSATGKLLWDACCWAHTPTCASVADLDRNGRREVVMGNTYTTAVVYSPDGKVIGKGGGSGHAGPTAIATADLDGNGKGEIVVGDRAGRIWFSEFRGRPLPRHETGSEIADVAIADLDADGRLETIVVSRNFLIYIFDADGKPRSFRSLLTVCRDIAVGDVTGDGLPEIVCACDDGTVRVLDANLQTLAESTGQALVRKIALADLDGDGRPEIISASDDATVSAFSYEGK